jgi:predicted dehydrogenase
MNKEKMKVVLIGCGNISRAYLTNLTGQLPYAEIVACADLDFERAKAMAESKGKDDNVLYPNLKAVTLEEAYASEAFDIILNLTIPAAHYPVAKQGIESGKHVYGEKPFCVNMREAKEIMALAQTKGVRLGCAPDTFLGAGLQTARKLIDDGWIGKPIAANVDMNCHGHEGWHPDPAFYYQHGGGPLYDMGPYYITALVHLLGPVECVTGLGNKAFEQRVIGSEPKKGEVMDVEIDTQVMGLLSFKNGAAAHLNMSFDTWKSDKPWIEIHGTEGSLSVPDPNTFGGEVKVCRRDSKGQWEEVPLPFHYDENTRGLGVSDMARAIQNNEKHRASGDLALHVLEIMEELTHSCEKKEWITLRHPCEQPEAWKMNEL